MRRLLFLNFFPLVVLALLFVVLLMPLICWNDEYPFGYGCYARPEYVELAASAAKGMAVITIPVFVGTLLWQLISRKR